MKCWWHCLPHTRPWLHRTSYEYTTTLKNRKRHKYKGKYINRNTKQRQDKSTIIKPKTAIHRIHNWGQKQGRLHQVFICLIIWTLLSHAACIWCHQSVIVKRSSTWPPFKIPAAKNGESWGSRGGWLIDWLTGWKMAQSRASTIPHRTFRASTNHPSQNMGGWAEQRPTE